MFETEGWAHEDAMVFMIIQSILGKWSRSSGAGTYMTSQLCSRVANENIANTVESSFVCYKDTSLLGVYAECESEHLDRLMEVTMEV